MSKVDHKAAILDLLGRCNARASLGWIAERRVKRGRSGCFSAVSLREYNDIGRALQELKREGRIVYVGGSGAGWRLA